MASSYGEDASKQALRSAYLEVPTPSPSYAARMDGDILSHLRAYPRYRAANTAIVFPSQREECDTAALAQQAAADHKRVVVALVDRDGAFTLYEIDDRKTSVELTDEELADSVCFVPGLVFDGEGYRVAYGAGYVDNFLRTYPGCSIAAVRSIQVSSNPLPRDPHDEPVDVLVSDSAVWHCRR